ncbi:MAG: autoinducer binding domain-containing protein, partial [Lentilitoribacter sp.]
MRDLEKILEGLQSALSREEAFSVLNQSIIQYGYSNVCYTLMTDHPSINQSAYHGLATSYPEDWIKHYNENEYQKYDAVWQRLLRSTTPFFWNDTLSILKKDNSQNPQAFLMSEKIIREAEEAKVADGAGFSFLGKSGEIAGIGLSREKNENANDVRDLSELYMITTVFHEKFISTYQTDILTPLTDRQLEV